MKTKLILELSKYPFRNSDRLNTVMIQTQNIQYQNSENICVS